MAAGNSGHTGSILADISHPRAHYCQVYVRCVGTEWWEGDSIKGTGWVPKNTGSEAAPLGKGGVAGQVGVLSKAGQGGCQGRKPAIGEGGAMRASHWEHGGTRRAQKIQGKKFGMVI